MIWDTYSIGTMQRQRLNLMVIGLVRIALVHTLLCFQKRYAVGRPLYLASAIISRLFSKGHHSCMGTNPPRCIAKLLGHAGSVVSVAFHPSELVVASGSRDNTAKLWRLRPNRYTVDAACVATLQHGDWVNSVSFHPRAPILATGSHDCCAKLWQLGPDFSTVSHATLAGHQAAVTCVAFHHSLPIVGSCSADLTARLWRMPLDRAGAPMISEGCACCYATLRGHTGGINALAFHPHKPIMATCSSDNSAKLWRVEVLDDGSALAGGVDRCFATLTGHTASVSSVAFHPRDPIIATGSEDMTARLWRLGADGTVACTATLDGHMSRVHSVAFAPHSPVLATGCFGSRKDNSTRLWLLSPDCAAATCVCSVVGEVGSPLKSLCGVNSVAFHPVAPVLMTGSHDNTCSLWH